MSVVTFGVVFEQEGHDRSEFLGAIWNSLWDIGPVVVNFDWGAKSAYIFRQW